MKLPTMYIVTTAQSSQNFDYKGACAAFDICVKLNEPVRVFKIEFDVETNAFETASEITGDLADRLI